MNDGHGKFLRLGRKGAMPQEDCTFHLNPVLRTLQPMHHDPNIPHPRNVFIYKCPISSLRKGFLKKGNKYMSTLVVGDCDNNSTYCG